MIHDWRGRPADDPCSHGFCALTDALAWREAASRESVATQALAQAMNAAEKARAEEIRAEIEGASLLRFGSWREYTERMAGLAQRCEQLRGTVEARTLAEQAEKSEAGGATVWPALPKIPALPSIDAKLDLDLGLLLLAVAACGVVGLKMTTAPARRMKRAIT